MTTSGSGLLIYGYDLGTIHEWFFQEVDDCDAPLVDWYDAYADDPGEFTVALTRQLLNRSGFTETYDDGKPGYHGREREAIANLSVKLYDYGREYCGSILGTACYESDDDCQPLDLAVIAADPRRSIWDDRLHAVLQDVLGITPRQAKPAWLLTCSYY